MIFRLFIVVAWGTLFAVVNVLAGSDYEYSDNIRDFLSSAAQLTSQGRLAEAETEYENVLQLDPQNKSAALPLFEIYVKRKEIKPANRLLERIRKMGVDPSKIGELEAMLKEAPLTSASPTAVETSGAPVPGTSSLSSTDSTTSHRGVGRSRPTTTDHGGKTHGVGGPDDLLETLDENVGPSHPSTPGPDAGLGSPPSHPAHRDPRTARASPVPQKESSSPLVALPSAASPSPSIALPASPSLSSVSASPVHQELSAELAKVRKGASMKMTPEDYVTQGRDLYRRWQVTRAKEDFARAEATLTGATIRVPSSLESHFFLGLLLLDSSLGGNGEAKKQAKIHLRKALDLGPDPKRKEEIEGMLKGL